MAERWAIRWRDDAQGFVEKYAGKVASRLPFESFDEAEEVRRAMPNGAQAEVVRLAPDVSEEADRG